MWNAHKAVIRGTFIQIGSRAKKERTQPLDEVMADIAVSESLNKTNPSLALQNKIFSLRQELRSLLLASFEKSQRKLKAKMYSTGNKAGKVMASKIKGQCLKSKNHFLYHLTTNEKILKPQAIAETFSLYYSSLYNIQDDHDTHQPSQEDIQSFLNHIKLPSLSQQQLSILNEPFTIQEILQVIHKLPNSKSPGPDGFTGEHYKRFQHLLAPLLCKIYNNVASSSSFPSEMLSALVVTIPKPGKDPTTPKNFRPISLLNIDLKIYAKLIAERLIEILPTLIHPDQSEFTKGRQTSDATRRIINNIHHAESSGTPSLLLSLDREGV